MKEWQVRIIGSSILGNSSNLTTPWNKRRWSYIAEWSTDMELESPTILNSLLIKYPTISSIKNLWTSWSKICSANSATGRIIWEMNNQLLFDMQTKNWWTSISFLKLWITTSTSYTKLIKALTCSRYLSQYYLHKWNKQGHFPIEKEVIWPNLVKTLSVQKILEHKTLILLQSSRIISSRLHSQILM